MAAKKYKPLGTSKPQSQLTVGYARLPSKVRQGSRAYFAKTYTTGVRQSMAEVLANFQKLIDTVKGITPEALEAALAPTFEKSQGYCPVDTGALVDSGSIESGVEIGDKAFCRISYGNGGQIHYAAIVHERTDLHHTFPTRAKFLQSAVEEDMGDLRSRFVKAIESILR